MGTGSTAARLQAGAISTALTGLAGFAAGALLTGLVAFTRHPVPIATESPRTPASNLAPNDVVQTPTTPYGDRAWPNQAEPFPWPFEAAGPARAPGAKRPDRLSGPDGWTYDPAPGP